MSAPAATPRLLTPALTFETLTGALGAADLQSATACFCRDAKFITADRTAVVGRPEISRLLAQLIDQRATFELDNLSLIETAEVSLAGAGLTICSPRPEGVLHARHSELTAVLRLIEGDWKLAILSPWGRPSPGPR
jgi:ketosteroid isomerase-like protein